MATSPPCSTPGTYRPGRAAAAGTPRRSGAITTRSPVRPGPGTSPGTRPGGAYDQGPPAARVVGPARVRGRPSPATPGRAPARRVSVLLVRAPGVDVRSRDAARSRRDDEPVEPGRRLLELQQRPRARDDAYPSETSPATSAPLMDRVGVIAARFSAASTSGD